MGGIPKPGAGPEALPRAGGADHPAGGFEPGALPPPRRQTPAGSTRERPLAGAKRSRAGAPQLPPRDQPAKPGRLDAPAADPRRLRGGAPSGPRRPLVRRRALPVRRVALRSRATGHRRARRRGLPARPAAGPGALPPPGRRIRRGRDALLAASPAGDRGAHLAAASGDGVERVPARLGDRLRPDRPQPGGGGPRASPGPAGQGPRPRAEGRAPGLDRGSPRRREQAGPLLVGGAGLGGRPRSSAGRKSDWRNPSRSAPTWWWRSRPS